jgi:hypothetical protein
VDTIETIDRKIVLFVIVFLRTDDRQTIKLFKQK